MVIQWGVLEVTARFLFFSSPSLLLSFSSPLLLFLSAFFCCLILGPRSFSFLPFIFLPTFARIFRLPFFLFSFLLSILFFSFSLISSSFFPIILLYFFPIIFVSLSPIILSFFPIILFSFFSFLLFSFTCSFFLLSIIFFSFYFSF